ncbi:MAG: LEPR-XLL domain-containing protein, partial [Nitrospinaceae bacterium]|nr:LEPR-XLL domain-containing protein [Nitrospinaceae bacterium]NIR57414.1 LEPR-XLL domain-containing protein [Nitrospinaceae bacterium]NIS87872.1 LEPR-XLL domain-containing protein [Nitrospinaceae bacterium]NIT82922.1 LEPR-XLL domain-containing protein [Nitrospinaceae bacterium]NIU45122.1 LEPR-XLL domain-containing protein [Nitrospinaceae bacterium]
MAFPFGGGTANSPAAAYEPLLGEKKKAFGKRKSKIGKKKSKGRKSASGKRNQPVYEALEPRLLLSADLTYGAYTDLTLQYDGVDTFELVHDVDGTVSSATRDLTDDRIVIAGTSGDDQLTLNWGSLGSETIVFDNPEDDFDILSITADGDFTLTENEITINGKTVTVTGFEAAHLTGGSGDTTMNVAGFAGQANLHGGGGKNTLKVQADSDISLDDSNLNLGGKAFGLSGFTHADLTGGASANQLNASGFSGNTILRGLGGADSLFGGSGNDIFIDDGDADVLSGGLGTDTLTGGDLGGVWNLTSLDSGTKDAASFSGIENLLGGTGTDIFNFVDGAGVSGSLDGGGGSDTLDYSGRSLGVSIDLGGGVATDVAAFTGIENLTGSAASDTLTGADTDNSWNLTGADAGTVGAVTFSGIETLAGGSGTDTLVGTDSANTWTLTGTDEGTVGAVAFTGIENLTGGAGDDTFQLTGSGGLTGTLAGGAGTDTLVGADTDNTWEITGANAGNLNGLLFSDMENLTGGAGADTFKFIGTGSISGIIDGGGGLNVLDYSQSSTAAAVNLAESAASGTGQIANIGGVTGSAGDDTLRGLDTANVWNLTGLDTGTVGAFTFTDVENLEGGTAEDVFNIDPSGDLTGLISGGLGEDTLAGADQLNTWEVTGEDDGSLNGLPFLDIENLLGGSDEDQFLFAIGGFVSGAFSGGLGADRLRGANQRNTWRVKGSNSGQLNDQDFSGIENLEGGGDADDFFLEDAGSLDGGLSGGAGDDTLYGPSPDTTWNVTGTNAGNVAGVSFTDTESLTGAADNEDTFVIGPGASVSGLIEGGDAGFDTIVIQPGDYTEKIYTATGPQSGSISLDGTVIQYAGVEPLTDLDGDANIIVFNLTAGNDTDATLTSSSATDFTLDGSTFELTNFTVTGA